MRFREKAQHINLMRTDALGGAPISVGKLDRSNMALTDELRAKLTTDEVAEVENYIAVKGNATFIDQQYAAAHFTETLELVSEWLKVAPAEEASRFVEDTHKAMRKLRQQLVRSANAGADASTSDED